MQITDDITTDDATVVLTLSLLLSRLGRVQLSLTLLSLLVRLADFDVGVLSKF